MSIISRVKQDLSGLADVLHQYDVDATEAASTLAINENMLGKANLENAAHQLYYDERRAELHQLVKFMEMRVKVARSKLYVNYTQTYNRDLTETGKEKYIDGEPAFLSVHELSLEVKELHEKYQAICNAFQTRGYAINNLTKLAIAEIKDIAY